MTDFYQTKFRDENDYIPQLMKFVDQHELSAGRIEQQTRVFVETIQQKIQSDKSLNALFQRYDLTSYEGLALMTLAEALLRIPDNTTIDALIKDKLSQGDWDALFANAKGAFASLSKTGLNLSQKLMDNTIGKIGMPFIRSACLQAMQLIGGMFVLGRDIEEALKKAQSKIDQGYCYNYDMLGEGARTAKDAEAYFNAYAHAIRRVGNQYPKQDESVFKRHGVSVKLSALYPRYEFAQQERAKEALTTRLIELCTIASQYNINLTIDAEECDRLALSLDIIKSIIDHPITNVWQGFGFAVQAYGKRAMDIIDMALRWQEQNGTHFAIRLVKGAYWDSEIKHAQIEGHPDYPVFTRKENTDLSYIACAIKLLAYSDKIYPLFATHNAQTVATIMEAGRDKKGQFMFQRLHGMGEALHDQVLSMGYPVSTYAPVGTHQYLLAYLVRRLLENGANSSFVNKLYNPNTPLKYFLTPPWDSVHKNHPHHHNTRIPKPVDIFNPRKNSIGHDYCEDTPYDALYQGMTKWADTAYHGLNIIPSFPPKNTPSDFKDIINPSNRHDVIGRVVYGTNDMIDHGFKSLRAGYPQWNATPVADRANMLDKIGDLYEQNTHEILSLLTREAGKTLSDAIGELREAVDFCRYYAHQARTNLTPQTMHSYTGENNILSYDGKGICVCISPWNFPLAIFTGQIVAALVAGNCVMAKPAEQTPAIATFAIQLMIKAGIPSNVIALIQGDGGVGQAILNHDDIQCVVFTGSTEVAKSIHQNLAAKSGAIIPLIAETGGINAMIVDSTALPEQVTDDVMLSAFGSAGQRCSALRILCIQDEVDDDIITMIKGAMDELVVGDPSYLSTDIGPIIDEEAKANLLKHTRRIEGLSKHIHYTPYDERLDGYGTFLPPMMAEMDDVDMIETEAFGPILNIIRYKANDLGTLIEKLNAKGFGLTFGLHTRIPSRQVEIAHKINAGNIYINRGQTGAIVGVQPFGGRGLSGTGPKAGGPNYLHAFTNERHISNNITACGGNVALLNLKENK